MTNNVFGLSHMIAKKQLINQTQMHKQRLDSNWVFSHSWNAVQIFLWF